MDFERRASTVGISLTYRFIHTMKQQVTRLARRAPSLASGLPATQASSARTRLVTSNSSTIIQQRSLFGLFGKKDTTSAKPASASGAFTSSPPPPRTYTPLYGPDDLFHPLESSPIPALRQKAATIKSLAPCPVCLDHSVEQAKASGLSDAEAYRQARTTVEKVKFSCPDCGFPTHSSEAHWQQDHEQHQEYCARLREINEDEHDLRSGREIKEFELPGAQDYESTPSLASWDALFYTRNFGSVDSERSRRHASKLLTYPMTIASVLHRLGPYAAGRTGTGSEGSRLTSEGQRSMAGESRLRNFLACTNVSQPCIHPFIPRWEPLRPRKPVTPRSPSDSSSSELERNHRSHLTSSNKFPTCSPLRVSSSTLSVRKQRCLRDPRAALRLPHLASLAMNSRRREVMPITPNEAFIRHLRLPRIRRRKERVIWIRRSMVFRHTRSRRRSLCG